MKIQRVGIDARMLSLNPTGVGNYIDALLRPMCEAQPQSSFILYSNSIIDFQGFKNVTIRQGGARIGPAWLNTQVVAALRRDKVDVFWGANGIAPVIGDVPTVVTVHDLVYRFAGQTMGRGARWTKRAFQGWSVRRARQVVAVSQATADDVLKVYGRAVDDIIPPIAHATFCRKDRPLVEAAVARYGLPADYWLCAGTLEPRKNLVAMLGAYLDAIAAGMKLPLLALAGNPGWHDHDLNALIARGEGIGRVRRIGYVPLHDLACLYAGCRLLWMPSIYEGFGMPLLEAQRCGAPVAHGDHASMIEASAGLGLATATDQASLRALIEAVDRNEAPLACRLEQPTDAEAARASERLWNRFCAAAERRSPVLNAAS